jgi:hypothetical protein
MSRQDLAERARLARGGIERALAESGWPICPKLSRALDWLLTLEESDR